MKLYLWVLGSIWFLSGSSANAQCYSRPEACVLDSLAKVFPPLTYFGGTFQTNYQTQASTTPNEAAKFNPAGPEVGAGPAFKSMILDNINAKVDFRYSKTLEVSTGTNMPTPINLTKVQFIPTYSVAYEFKFGQWVNFWHQARAGRNLSNAKQLQYDSELAKLRKAYVEFEQARKEFSLLVSEQNETKRPEDKVTAAFYKLKSKGLEVLAIAHEQGPTMNNWLASTY